jgi:hypothetical protein
MKVGRSTCRKPNKHDREPTRKEKQRSRTGAAIFTEDVGRRRDDCNLYSLRAPTNGQKWLLARGLSPSLKPRAVFFPPVKLLQRGEKLSCHVSKSLARVHRARHEDADEPIFEFYRFHNLAATKTLRFPVSEFLQSGLHTSALLLCHFSVLPPAW